MKRFSFSLLEVLISSSLAIIVMVACMSLFFVMQKRVQTSQKTYATVQQDCQKIMAVRSVLQNIRALPYPRAQKYPFYTLDETCIFVFNNDIDPRYGLSGDIDGMLYIDPAQGLMLVQKSKIKTLPCEAAVCLWPRASAITWRFFPSPASSLPKQWYATWDKNWQEIPLIIEMTITEHNQQPHVITVIVTQAIDEAIVSS